MPDGILAKAFSNVAVKRLSAVEANKYRSHQHEINGVAALRRIMGTADRRDIPTMFVWLGGEQEALSEEGFLSWYQARTPPRNEYRLYFPTTEVSELAEEGDSVFIANCPNGTMMVIVTPSNSTMENQIAWLFDLQEQFELGYEVREIGPDARAESEFAVRFILEELGLEPEEPGNALLDIALERFGKKFPTTRVFSEFSRSTVPEVFAKDNADQALLKWMNQEELLFRRLEKHIITEHLKNNLVDQTDPDVDKIMSFFLSSQNRRKSRVGLALENHLEEVFQQNGISYSRGSITENRAKPDFLFPSIKAYKNREFPRAQLTMLGVKSTCKDRWRQVLSEAHEIEQKHLLTLEPGISTNQTEEMNTANLQLVVPTGLQDSYTADQREWLIDLQSFIELAKSRQ